MTPRQPFNTADLRRRAIAVLAMGKGATGKWIATLVVLVGVGLAATYYSPGSEPEGTAAPQRIAVRLAESRDVTTALLQVAHAKGYFADAGLEVETREYPSGKRSLEGLFAGEVDFAVPSETPVVISSFDHRDMYIVASFVDAGSNQRIVGRRDHGIEQPADLRGKRIATQKGSAVHYFLYVFLLKHGLSVRDIRLTFLPAEELAPALARGEIDAFSMREPYISEARRLLGDKAVVFDAPRIYRRHDLLVVRHDFLRAHPEAARRALRALARAEEFVRREPQAAIAIVAAHSRIPEAAVARDWKEYNFRLSLPQELLANLDEQARWALDSGLVEARPTPNYLELIHLDALKAVQPAAVTVIH